MRSDGLWKGRSGGIGYAARDMARQVKWEDPALRREREKERERTRASGRRACEKEEREKEREKRESDESDNAVEGSEEYFDESEHVDGFAAEERSSDGEEVE